MVDAEVYQGFTTDQLKADIPNINVNKASGPDKIHPMFLHHMGLVSISLLTSMCNKSWAETNMPQEWRVADIRPILKGWKDLRKMASYGPGQQPSTIFC